MGLGTESVDDLLVITLVETYDERTIEEMVNLARSSQIVGRTRHIIVDCSRLGSLKSFGGEFFALKKEITDPRKGHFVFAALNSTLRPVVNQFSYRWFGEDIIVFARLEDARRFIKGG